MPRAESQTHPEIIREIVANNDTRAELGRSNVDALAWLLSFGWSNVILAKMQEHSFAAVRVQAVVNKCR
jgi:hypothetical protein